MNWMIWLAIGITVGGAIGMIFVYFANERNHKLVKENLNLKRMLSVSEVWPEEFERLAHANYALKQIVSLPPGRPLVKSEYKRITEEADEVIRKNKLCPEWYKEK